MTLKLITAILMTMAALAWVASALLVSGGDDTLLRWIVAAMFVVLAVFYWRGYLRLKHSTAGTE